MPWCVGRAFDMVWFLSESLGAEFFTPVMHEFLNVIADHSLLDLPLEGCALTWSNSHEVVSRSRLDRFLLSPDWEDKLPTVNQCRMETLLSDHFLILLEGNYFQRVKDHLDLRTCG